MIFFEGGGGDVDFLGKLRFFCGGGAMGGEFYFFKLKVELSLGGG